MSKHDISDNVIVVTFENDSNAYEALTRLKGLDGQDQVRLRGAAVVSRQPDGPIAVKDEVDGDGFSQTAGGSLVRGHSFCPCTTWPALIRAR